MQDKCLTIIMAKKPNKVGRPKLQKGEAKGTLIAARFSPPEVKEIDGAVKRSNGNKSQWVRNCLLTAARSGTV
jgi:hypothetical protein